MVERTVSPGREGCNRFFALMCQRPDGQGEGGAGHGGVGGEHGDAFGPNGSEFAFDLSAGEIRLVAVTAEVGAVNVAQVRFNKLLEKFRGPFVGEVAVPAEDALLELPRPVGIVIEQVHVVVSFQHQHLGRPDAVGNEPGALAEVSQEANARGGGVQQETDRVDGVMRHGERFHGEIADLNGVPSLKQAKLEVALVYAADFLGGMAIAINGQPGLLSQHAQALYMIGMFVRDEYAVEPFGRAILRQQPLANAPGADAAIEQQARAGRLQIRGIAAAAAGQNGEPHLLHGRHFTASHAELNGFQLTAFARVDDTPQAVCVPLRLLSCPMRGNNRQRPPNHGLRKSNADGTEAGAGPGDVPADAAVAGISPGAHARFAGNGQQGASGESRAGRGGAG